MFLLAPFLSTLAWIRIFISKLSVFSWGSGRLACYWVEPEPLCCANTTLSFREHWNDGSKVAFVGGNTHRSLKNQTPSSTRVSWAADSVQSAFLTQLQHSYELCQQTFLVEISIKECANRLCRILTVFSRACLEQYLFNEGEQFKAVLEELLTNTGNHDVESVRVESAEFILSRPCESRLGFLHPHNVLVFSSSVATVAQQHQQFFFNVSSSAQKESKCSSDLRSSRVCTTSIATWLPSTLDKFGFWRIWGSLSVLQRINSDSSKAKKNLNDPFSLGLLRS